jgi:hypothetical protein
VDSRVPDRTIVVARRFRGPDTGLATGNGGYFCGLVATAAPTATAIEIRSRTGIPLERPLTVREEAGRVEVLDDGALVARAGPERLAVQAPAPPPVEVALEASRRFQARLDDGSVRHPFPECFVCGHRRAIGDGLRLFTGPLSDDGLDRGQFRVAGWQPDPALLDPEGRLRPEFVWAALDCPGGWALAEPINTGTLQVEIREPVDGRQCLIVMGWRAPGPPQPRAGSRRRYVGTAMFDEGGRLLALGAAIWVAPDSRAPAP